MLWLKSEMDLKHVVKKVHSCASHVDGYRVEEEDRVVFRHTELVDHCAVRNMEAFANLLVKREHSERWKVLRIEQTWSDQRFSSKGIPQEYGGCPQDICTGGESPKHQEHPKPTLYISWIMTWWQCCLNLDCFVLFCLSASLCERGEVIFTLIW